MNWLGLLVGMHNRKIMEKSVKWTGLGKNLIDQNMNSAESIILLFILDLEGPCEDLIIDQRWII